MQLKADVRYFFLLYDNHKHMLKSLTVIYLNKLVTNVWECVRVCLALQVAGPQAESQRWPDVDVKWDHLSAAKQKTKWTRKLFILAAAVAFNRL